MEETSDVWKLAAITSFSVLAVVLVSAALIIGVMLHRRKSHKRPLRGKIHKTSKKHFGQRCVRFQSESQSTAPAEQTVLCSTSEAACSTKKYIVSTAASYTNRKKQRSPQRGLCEFLMLHTKGRWFFFYKCGFCIKTVGQCGNVGKIIKYVTLKSNRSELLATKTIGGLSNPLKINLVSLVQSKHKQSVCSSSFLSKKSFAAVSETSRNYTENQMWIALYRLFVDLVTQYLLETWSYFLNCVWQNPLKRLRGHFIKLKHFSKYKFGVVPNDF